MKTYLVQVGKGLKGSYKTQYSFKDTEQDTFIAGGNRNSRYKASFYYAGINIGNNYKKRLVVVENGVKTVLSRYSSCDLGY